MKRVIFITALLLALTLTACGGSSNVPEGADAKAWNAGYESLQYLDDWEDNGDNPDESGIAAKVMEQANSIGFTDDLFMKDNKSEKEQYINDMYWVLHSLAGFKKGQYFTGLVFSISDDGQKGTDEDYEKYYESKQHLVELLQIDYTEDYTLLDKR